MLAEFKGDVNAANKNGVTPLLMASQNGHTDTIRLLVKLNANVNQVSKYGISPILMAGMYFCIVLAIYYISCYVLFSCNPICGSILFQLLSFGSIHY